MTRLVNNNSSHHKGVPLLYPPRKKKAEYNKKISLTLIRITLELWLVYSL